MTRPLIAIPPWRGTRNIEVEVRSLVERRKRERIAAEAQITQVGERRDDR